MFNEVILSNNEIIDLAPFLGESEIDKKIKARKRNRILKQEKKDFIMECIKILAIIVAIASFCFTFGQAEHPETPIGARIFTSLLQAFIVYFVADFIKSNISEMANQN